MEGVVTIQLGDETIVAGAESVIRVPPGVPSRYSQSGARLSAPSAQRLRIVSISSGTPRSSKVLHAQTEPWTRKPAGPEAQLRSPADRALAMLALRPLTAALARFRST
jgi:hypothetical protein